jgi:hypothetical protein
MRTTILAYVIAFLGLVMIGTGAWTLFNLFGERDRGPVPQRYYAMAIAMICIGFAMGGIAQALRRANILAWFGSSVTASVAMLASRAALIAKIAHRLAPWF